MAANTKNTVKPATAPEGFVPIGQNVYAKASTTDSGMLLWFDTAADLGRTTSGKSNKVASTGGNVTLAGGLKLGVNCYDPIKAV